MIKFFRQYGYVIYLSGVLSIVDCSLFNWEFYVITIPVILLVSWKIPATDREENKGKI
jgi:hypothetical protein